MLTAADRSERLLEILWFDSAMTNSASSGLSGGGRRGSSATESLDSGMIAHCSSIYALRNRVGIYILVHTKRRQSVHYSYNDYYASVEQSELPATYEPVE
jgi:hypothetical protein